MPEGHSEVAFPETRWTRVLAVRSRDPASAEVRAALSDLCERYWYPLYAFARRGGQSPHDAEDLTQGFFVSLISHDLFAAADPAKGRLRSFLLVGFKRFMAQEWRHQHREKRGGDSIVLSLDTERAEAEYLREPATDAAPDLAFDRTWTNLVLNNALSVLETEYRDRAKAALFEVLRDFLAWNTADERVRAVAAQLRMSEGAVRVAVHRLRQRFRQTLVNEVAQTVASKSDLETELRELLRSAGG